MSKVIESWDNAEFEEVAEQRIGRFNRKDIKHAIRESRYAVKLIELLETSSAEFIRFDKAKDNIRVVTILHASLPHHTGGYTGRAQGLLKGMADNGIEVRAYTRPGFFSEKVDSSASFPYPVDEVDGVLYHHLPAEFPRRNGEIEYMFRSVGWYREVFLAERPNVVHLRSTYLIALPALVAAHQLRIPVVYEVSGLWELVYEGRGQVGRARRTERFEGLVCEHADRVVTMNNSMANLLAQRSVRELETGLVPNAVDLDRFQSITPLERRKTFDYDFGYVGSLVDYEGLDVLVRAVSRLKEEGTLVRGKIVGKGQEFSTLKNLIEKLGLEQQIELTGPVPAEQAVQQFEDINLVVLPRISTPATENVTPLKPFEAMAAGRPLLVSSVSALREVSRNGTIAEVFEQANAADCAAKIKMLLFDRERQLELTASAKRVVKEEHNWKSIAKLMTDELRRHAVSTSALPTIAYAEKITSIGQFTFSGLEQNK